MNRRVSLRNTMLDWAKAIHEAIGIESPRLFIALFALIGLLLFGFVGWVIDRGYRIKLREPHSDSPIPPAKASEKVASTESISTLSPTPLLPLPNETTGRIFVPADVDGKFLLGLYKKTTSVQADALAAFYIGKWIRLSAPVADVFTQGDEIFVLLTLAADTRFALAILSFEAAQWSPSVSMLTSGSTIMVAGEIQRVSTMSIRLKCCELL